MSTRLVLGAHPQGGAGSAAPSSPGTRGARGLYVHIPFCLVRCAYCDFNAYAGMDDLIEPYVEALLREIGASADGGHLDTIFFGGGTPTQIPPIHLASLLAEIRRCFEVPGNAEITVEANPETVDEEVIEALLAAGFNRLSVGVQSLSPRVLRDLGRAHSAERGLRAVEMAAKAGFSLTNADLIYGTPGESMDEWLLSLDAIIQSGAGHISAYALTIEEGTPLASWIERGDSDAPDEDDQAEKYEAANERLTSSGFVRYEISNWARPGEWCLHNVNYWQAGDYLGLGAGAHGHAAGRRYWNVRNPRAYITRSPRVEEGHESLPWEKRIEEAIVLGMRLGAGVNRSRFAARFGVDPVRFREDEFRLLEGRGLVDVARDSVRVLPKSAFLAGYVARTLMR